VNFSDVDNAVRAEHQVPVLKLHYPPLPFLSRVSTLTRDIAILSVRDVPVSDENGLTYRHRFYTIRS